MSKQPFTKEAVAQQAAQEPAAISRRRARASRRRPRRIVVGTDVRGRTEEAYPVIVEIGRRLLAEVVLVHNFDPASRPRYDTGAMAANPAAHLRSIRDHLERRLEQAAMRLREAGVPTSVTIDEQATPARAILEHASEIDADLIVLVTDGDETFSDRLLGTVVTDVVREGLCPVLSLTPSQAADGASWRRILAPIDFSDESREALLEGLRWVPEDARLDLLYVVEPGFPTFHGARGAGGDHFDAESLEHSFSSDIADFLSDVDEPKLKVEAHLVQGSELQQALERAEGLEAELLVVNARTSALGRSLGEQLANRPLPCPVLAVPAPADDR